MTKGWAWNLLWIFLIAVIAGCSNVGDKPGTKERNVLAAKIDSVEKVSVLTTDGQEIGLDMATIKKELPLTTEELYRSTERLKEEEVRYTLLAYHESHAPLVIEVGESACQFEDVTYRGKDASLFYQKIAELTGQALIKAPNVQSIDVEAVDKNGTVRLTSEQSSEIWQMIRQAIVQKKPKSTPYPLFPHYRLRIDFGERIREITVLTPSLVSIQVGKDTQYMRVSGSLFSLLTKYIPPQPEESKEFDQLFKAEKIIMLAAGQKEPQLQEGIDPILLEGVAHQFVRILQNGTRSTDSSLQNEKVRYKIILLIGNTRKECVVYESGFYIEGKGFKHSQIIRQLEELLLTYKLLVENG
ncbi:hypothetical protein [Brevibacillus sp. SYSU BS000544]|uniref:hypothetical protein n=1 Tax=Brevibacillus sp. SYSU BS000544 TaxID=3416443 RepID=UPI003CE4FF4D